MLRLLQLEDRAASALGEKEPFYTRNTSRIHAVRRVAVQLVVVLASSAAVVAQSGGDSSVYPSPRNANYTIEARLDPSTLMIEGKQVLLWRNIQSEPTDELWFHLYWNAWRNNRSSWLLREKLGDKSDLGEDVDEDDWAYLDVESVALLPPPGDAPDDLSDRMRFAAPDDGNRRCFRSSAAEYHDSRSLIKFLNCFIRKYKVLINNRKR